MNKKGQMILLKIMLAAIIFIMVVQFIPILTDETITLRNPTNLDCDNSSISTGNQITCIVGDWFTPYYFGVAIAVIGAIIIGGRKLGFIE